MARVIPVNPIKMWLRVESARAKAVWPDIKATPEFKIALWLFAVCILGLAVLGLISNVPPHRGEGAHPPPEYVIRPDVASP
jgi:hypothetical protein